MARVDTSMARFGPCSLRFASNAVAHGIGPVTFASRTVSRSTRVSWTPWWMTGSSSSAGPSLASARSCTRYRRLQRVRYVSDLRRTTGPGMGCSQSSQSSPGRSCSTAGPLRNHASSGPSGWVLSQLIAAPRRGRPTNFAKTSTTSSLCSTRPVSVGPHANASHPPPYPSRLRLSPFCARSRAGPVGRSWRLDWNRAPR
jgi:hypothetical protein